MTTPTALTAGDSYTQLIAHADYSAADGWVMKQRFTPRLAGSDVIDMTATAEGSAHRFAATATASAAWIPGAYTAARWVELGDAVHTLASWPLTITPNLRDLAPGTDLRSQALRALEDARAAFAAMSANPHVRRHKIGEREREFRDVAEILVLIRHWESQVEKEERLAGRRSSPSRRIYSRI